MTHNLPELPSRIARTGTALVTVSRALFMAGLTVIAIALFLIFPRFTVLASRTIGSDPVKSLGMGLLLFAAIPVLAILSMITILGIPLGIIIFVCYSVALLVGFVLAAFYLGDVGAQAFMGKDATKQLVRVAFLIVALGVLLLARQIPFIGAVVAVPVLGERWDIQDATATALMMAGVALLLRGRHAHTHQHEEVEHDHSHQHEEHHDHVHDEGPVLQEPHAHVHWHLPLTHDHPHLSELHHRHDH